MIERCTARGHRRASLTPSQYRYLTKRSLKYIIHQSAHAVRVRDTPTLLVPLVRRVDLWSLTLMERSSLLLTISSRLGWKMTQETLLVCPVMVCTSHALVSFMRQSFTCVQGESHVVATTNDAKMRQRKTEQQRGEIPLNEHRKQIMWVSTCEL